MDNNFIDTYIDSIINKYENLGKQPTVSLFSIHKDNNNLLIMLMYSYVNSNIHFENFTVYSNDLTIGNCYNNKPKPVYLNDLENIVLSFVKKFYFNNGSSN